MNDPEENRIFPKIIPGRKGHSEEMVRAIYADYWRLKSLAKCAALHGRTRQALHELFKSHGLPRYQRNFHSPVEFEGVFYTPMKGGYLRGTNNMTGRRELLHYAVWRKHHGPVPPTYQVTFSDGDKRNCAIENLRCEPGDVVRRRNSTGQNQFTRPDYVSPRREQRLTVGSRKEKAWRELREGIERELREKKAA